MNLTINNISFLKDIDSSIKVDMRSGWRPHYFDGLSISEISSFIKLIGNDKIYLLIPLFAGSKSFSTATLNLSEPFLVNNKSNSVLITNFILDQWQSSGFETGYHNFFFFQIQKSLIYLYLIISFIRILLIKSVKNFYKNYPLLIIL